MKTFNEIFEAQVYCRFHTFTPLFPALLFLIKLESFRFTNRTKKGIAQTKLIESETFRFINRTYFAVNKHKNTCNKINDFCKMTFF